MNKGCAANAGSAAIPDANTTARAAFRPRERPEDLLDMIETPESGKPQSGRKVTQADLEGEADADSPAQRCTDGADE
ncbi:hypothetical protein AB4084_33735, partial [Lysobacter sp. 2RAB21]